jgi:ATP-binding cassette, subfamily B, bacterial
MRWLLHLIDLSAKQWRALIGVTVLVSLSTASALFEPWVYRAVIDDVAGVLTSDSLTFAERAFDDVKASLSRAPASLRRVFSAPLQRLEAPAKRQLEPREPPEAIATILVAALLLVVVRLFSEVCRVRGDNLAASVSSDLERGLITRTFRHVTRLPLGAFTSRPSAAVTRQVDQSDQVSPLFVAASKQIWPELFSLVAVLSILGSLNAGLALIALTAVPVYIVVTWRLTRALNLDIDRYYAQWDQISSHVQEAIAGMKTVQSHGAGEQEVKRLGGLMDDAYTTYLRRTRTENRYTLVQNLLVGVSKAGVLALGGIRALEHQLTPGDIVLFLAYVDRIYNPIETLTGLYVELQQNLASLRRAERLLAEPEAADAGRSPLSAGPGRVEFDHVRFGYTDRPVLDAVTFCVQPGEHVALVGPSGAGKTTIADLLAGLYVPQSGEIRLDGQSVGRVQAASVHEAVRSVAADGTLFRASVRENIRYGRFDATDHEVVIAAERAGLSAVIARLPEGIDTEIGEGGITLSVGERQRVLLARAFVARPRVLILDEATANLDYRTEASVKKALEELGRGHTTITVAHRRSMLIDVDRVIVIRDGRIEQQGSPAELIRSGGYFSDLIRAEGSSHESL